MKKYLYSMLAAILLLSGCGSNSAAAEDIESAPESVSTTPVENALLEETETPASATVSATYISTNENFSGDYRPSVTFNQDGTFVMTENLYEGMGEYKGTYVFDGNYYECTVTDINFSGFAGDDVTKFEFLQFNPNTLWLLDNLCGSREKDVFTISDGSENSNEEYTIKPAQEVGAITKARLYENSSDMFSEPYLPSLLLNPDGTFVLTENLFAGMGHYSGTYTIDDYILDLHVDSVDFSGFAGDDVKEIRFEALSQDVLQLMTDLCGSVKFDYWYWNVDQ
ncbi:MAG: hypothetical protein IKE28_10195 [Solobacterium sp.]|nr:hypothetical protein [Solobacterium sp.]